MRSAAIRHHHTGSAAAGLVMALTLSCVIPPSSEPERGPAELPHVRRVAFRDNSPGVDPSSAAGQPRVLYRLGERWGRMEYPPDPERGEHRLVIVNEPHMWVVNLADQTGRYHLDPGPTYVFRAPVIEGETVPGALRALEFGKEFEFLDAHEATSTPETSEGKTLDRYQLEFGDFMLVVWAREGRREPIALAMFERKALRTAYRYLAYDTGLAPTRGMFLPPSGVRILEPGEEPPTSGRGDEELSTPEGEPSAESAP